MSQKNNISFYLNEKEGQAMRALWLAEKPLSAMDIANAINEEWAFKSIQNIIRTLEAKKAIKIAQITKIGKTYGRLFLPTVSTEDYALMQFKKFYTKKNDVPAVLTALIGNMKKDNDFSEKLKELLDSYKED